MLIPKLLYVALFMGLAAFAPFTSNIFHNRGMTIVQIGLLTSLPFFFGAIFSPLLLFLADKSNTHRSILIKTSVLALLSLLLLEIPRLLGQFELQTELQFYHYLIILSLYSLFSCPIIPLVDTAVLSMLHPHQELYGNQRMPGIYIITTHVNCTAHV
jgi:MFS family permease